MAEEHVAKKVASPLYLGFDFSTQQLKVVCIDNSLKITHKYNLNFDTDLQGYGTLGGVIKHDDGVTVTAPTNMWVKALDLLLCRMQEARFPFNRVVALSGVGQQHGSVYWKTGAEERLKNINPGFSIASQLQTFSIPQSPVWMDSSTTVQCRQLEEACGGAQVLADKTGSRAYERFTGNQIAKIYQQRKEKEEYEDYDDTERISLVSSFGATLFLCRYAPIDYSDGSGMNLLDIGSKDWWQTALEACAPNLREKLGKPVPSNTVLGNVSNYFVQKYNFLSDCKVIAFTGDNPGTQDGSFNPGSLAGMRLQEGDVVISLGTSDTLSLWINEAIPQLMGHIFVNPVDANAYMAMLCYKNGSLAREMVRDNCANKSWEEFNKLLNKTEPGNDGNIGIYFQYPEITPAGQGIYRFNKDNTQVETFTPEVECRAIIEGQFMAKFVHARKLGYKITSTSRVLATGGASTNTEILRIIADIFNTDVYILEGTANSASLGCAYRARHALMVGGTSFFDAVREAPSYTLAVSPRPHIHKEVYLPLTERYARLEDSVSSSRSSL